MLKNDLTVIIICYDPYADAIEASPHFLKEFWSDCTANILYISSGIDVSRDFRTVFTNGDLSYAHRLEAALECVRTPYILLLLDDYLVDKNVDEKRILSNTNYMKKNKIDFCQLFTMFTTPPGKKNKKDNVLIPKSNIKYRINLQPAIFSKKLLERLASKNPFTTWDAEMAFMSEEFDDVKAIFALNKSFSVTNYIDKGYATRKGYRLLKHRNMWHNQRKVQSIFKSAKMKIIRALYFYLPNSLNRRAKKKTEQ